MSNRRLIQTLALSAPLLAAGACALDQSCSEAEPVYTGTKSGTLILKQVSPDGTSSGSSMSSDVQGPFDTRSALSGGASCSSARGAEEKGWKATAWLDVDGDEVSACTADITSADCAPDANDPQGEVEFTLPAFGTTVYTVELRDP